MAVSSEQPAPYVAPGVLLPLLERNRERGLPNPLTPEQLQRLGVSDSLIPRTLQAFRTLDLIGEDGHHNDLLGAFRRAPEADYQPMMADWLRSAYAHVLDVLDPATADDTSIRDAFRLYNPISMQPRMITLFTSLFEVAGVRPSAPSPAPGKRAPQSSGAVRVGRPPLKPPAARAAAPRAGSDRVQTTHAPGVDGLHPALAGLLSSLPSPERGWTKDERERFMAAFGVVLDFAIPIGSGAKPDASREDEDQSSE